MPAILEPPQEAFASATGRSRTFARRFLVSTARFLVVLALGAMAGGGWYLARKGFGRKWRGIVVEELHKHGVEASVHRLTLGPFRGLVAKDVRIFDYKNHDNTIAQIKRNDYKPAKEVTPEEWQTRLVILQRLVSELNQFKFSERPHLQIKFSGDVAQLENARVEGTLQTGPWQRGNYQAQKLTMTGEF